MRVCAAVLTVLLLACAGLNAQVQYSRGQNVAPVFEGWQRNPDGTYNMVFGYLNRNYEEEVDIPLGQENSISIGNETFGDKGQPTHFYPRRQRFLFKVVVPRDWDPKQKVIWTLTSRGRTDQAKGWLQPEWELSDDVIVENMGGGVPDPGNKAPTLTVDSIQSGSVSKPVTLVAKSTDDGLPKPYRRSNSNPDRDSQPKRPRGVQIKWTQYRGPGKVVFEPDSSAVVYGEPVNLTAKATFSAPGIYILRATSNDGQLFTSQDVTITIKP